MPQLFFELLGESAERGNEYEFLSVEVKQTAYRIDGVFQPRAGSSEKAVIFTEFQFQKDERLYERLFSEIMLYLAQNLEVEDWRAIAVYPRRSIEQTNRYRYRTLLNSDQFQAIFLEDFLDLSTDQLGIQLIQLIISKKKETSKYLNVLVSGAQSRTDFENQAIIELVSTIMVYKFPELSREEIQAMFTVSDLKQTRVYQEALDEGREEGREQGAQGLVLRLLHRQLGQLSAESQAKILSLSLEQLELLGDALLNFSDRTELEEWLDHHS